MTGRAEIMDAVGPGGMGGTYAGNPVEYAAALGVFHTIEGENPVQKARDIEAAVLPRLHKLTGPDTSVGEARGRGAMLALTLAQVCRREH